MLPGPSKPQKRPTELQFEARTVESLLTVPSGTPHDYNGARVLVTGGAGFIGSHLVDTLLASGASYVGVIDTFFLGREANLADACQRYGSRLQIYREDAGDFGAMTTICGEVRPDFVFNLATKALLYSFFNPAGAFKVNVDIALTLAELLRAGAFGRLIQVSSSEVYGSACGSRMTESHPYHPETSYAAGKAGADLLLRSYTAMYDLDIVTVRPFNNYGPRQNDGALAGLVPVTIRRILANEAPVVEGDGLQTRDFMFVQDTVDALVALGQHGGPSGLALNIGSGEETSVLAVVQMICDALSYTGSVTTAPSRQADVQRHRADVTAAEQILGRVARTALADGLRTTCEWHLATRRPS